MGKHVRHRSEGSMNLQNNPPGCMWGILHVLKYHNWRHIKKRVPIKKNAGRKSASGAENPEFCMDFPSVCVLEDRSNHSNPEGSNLRVDGNPAQSTSSSKGSVKSRLKALILEERHKRKRHHRTATDPARSQLTRTDSIHRSEDPEPGSLLDDPAIGALNPFSSPSSDGSCGECSRMLAGRGMWYDYQKPHSGYEKLAQKHSVPNKKQKHKSECAKRLAKSASAIQSRHMMDAMDIFAMNKEFLLKVLQDPESPLGYHFHKNKDSASKIGLTKCDSFPLPGSSGRMCSRSRSIKQNSKKEIDSPNFHETRHRGESTEDICRRSMPLIAAEHRADGIMQLNHAKEIADHTAQNPKKSYDNQAVIKRFKDIKQKIVHAIKEGKKDTYRITMDAVLHRIPHKKGFSKDLTKENLDQFKLPGPGRKETSPLAHCTSKSRPQHFRRTSSLNESMERYVHLFECSCHRELEHQQTPDRLKLRAEEGAVLAPRSTPNPKFLGRILSSPELYNYAYQSEDDAFSTDMPLSNIGGSNLSLSSLNDYKSTDFSTDQEDQFLLSNELRGDVVKYHGMFAFTPDKSSDASFEVVAKVDDVDGLSSNLIGCVGLKIEPKTVLTDKVEESSPAVVLESNTEEDMTNHTEVSFLRDSLEAELKENPESMTNSPNISKDSIDSEEVEPSDADIDTDIFEFQVDAKDKLKFDYVRDVLELSGFSGNELLGSWHSTDQPVDPMVYEEVGGCILCDPESEHVDGERGVCNHQLLFDLINEVLMDVYEKSYCYCPRPLSCLSHIRPMPVRYHVLEVVWTNICWYLNFGPADDQPLDYVVSRDLSRDDGWMNLRFDTECVGLELEEVIFNDLLEEAMSS